MGALSDASVNQKHATRFVRHSAGRPGAEPFQI